MFRRLSRSLVILCLAGILAPVSAAASFTILVMGDSLSAGYGLRQDQSWPALLATRLKQEKPAYAVVNASISGETSSGGRARLPAALKQHLPAVVIIELGANDGLRGLPIPTLRDNLAAMITASRAAGARVLLVGMRLPPNFGPVYARSFQATYTGLAKTYHVPLVPFLLEGFADRQELFQADGLHPVAEAEPRILETVWPALKPLLAGGKR